MGPLPFDRPPERFRLGEERAVIELAAYSGAVHNEVLLQIGGPAQMLGKAVLRHHDDFAAPPSDLPDPSDPLCLRQELRLGDIVDPTGCVPVRDREYVLYAKVPGEDRFLQIAGWDPTLAEGSDNLRRGSNT